MMECVCLQSPGSSCDLKQLWSRRTPNENMARTRLCNLWSRRQLLVTFLEGYSGGGSLLPSSQAAQCLSHTRISKLSTSTNVVAKQPLAAAEGSDVGSVQQVAGGRTLPSSTTDDLESIRLRAWSSISQASPALSSSILPIPLAAQMVFIRRSGTRATAGKLMRLLLQRNWFCLFAGWPLSVQSGHRIAFSFLICHSALSMRKLKA